MIKKFPTNHFYYGPNGNLRVFLSDGAEQLAENMYDSFAEENIIKKSKNVKFSKPRLVKVQPEEGEKPSVAWEISFDAFNSQTGKPDHFYFYVSPSVNMKNEAGKDIAPVTFLVDQRGRSEFSRPVMPCNEEIIFTGKGVSRNYLYYDTGHSGDAACDADVYSSYDVGIQYEDVTEYKLSSKGLSENCSQEHRFFINSGEDEYNNPYIDFVKKGSQQEKYIIETLRTISQTGKAPEKSNISNNCVKNLHLIDKALQKCGEKTPVRTKKPNDRSR